ncbi:MAG: cation:proton antiporter [Gammaproteobacteria bacterium]
MEEHAYLAQILVLLAATALVVPLVQRIGLGAVPGYLLAGILVGPSVLGLVSEGELIRLAGEFGVVFLLFAIGIELSPARLWVLRRLVFGLGSLQLLGSALAIGVLAAWSGVDARAATVIGFGLAMSSTALVLQLLAERRELGTPEGRSGLSVLLLQDVAVAPLVSLVYLLGREELAAPGADALPGILRSLLLLTLFVVGGRWALRHLLPLAAASRNPDVLVTAALLLVLGAAALMQHAGFSMALGAFLAGVLLADSPFRHQVLADVQPFRGVLLGLFFVTVGMSLGIDAALAHWPLLLGLTLGFMLLKALLLAGAARLFGLNGAQSLRVGLQLAQGGEFALVLFALAGQQGLFDTALQGLLTQMLVLSLLLAPLGFRLGDRLAARMQPASSPGEEAVELATELSGHVVLCGYGRVGSQLGNLMESAGVPWVAADSQLQTVELARIAGLPVFFGDASRPALLSALRVSHAALAIVTLDDADAAERCVHALRQHAPHCRVVARSTDMAHASLLRLHGALRAVPETTEYSLQLGLAGLVEIGVDPDRIVELERSLRESDYAKLLQNRSGKAPRRR